MKRQQGLDNLLVSNPSPRPYIQEEYQTIDIFNIESFTVLLANIPMSERLKEYVQYTCIYKIKEQWQLRLKLRADN